MSNDFHFAVVVGINRYPDLRPLNGAKADAQAFEEWLEDSQGGDVPTANIMTILIPDNEMPDTTLREDAHPIRREVFNAIKAFEPAVLNAVENEPNVWDSTRLYIFMSGHGLAPGPRDAALLMADAGPDNYGENIACSSLLDYFGVAQPYHEVVIFSDCCRDRRSDAPLGPVLWTTVQRDMGEVKTALGCATEYGRSAFEAPVTADADPNGLRGFFTKALLEGFRGAAVNVGSGEINTTSLQQYVHQRVFELTEKRLEPQKAIIYTGMPIVFRSGLDPNQRPRHTISFEMATDFQGFVEIYGADGSVGQHDVTGPGDEWNVDLPFGAYKVEAANGVPAAFQNNGEFKVIGESKNVIL